MQQEASQRRSGKGRDAFRTISEVADGLDLPQHVLRFWESKFSQIKPLKRGGNRRYYRPDDVRLLTAIKQLLHNDGFTIRGVQKLFKEHGVKTVVAAQLGEQSFPEEKSNGAAIANDEAVASTQEKAATPDVEHAEDDALSAPTKATLQSLLSELKIMRALLD